MQTTIRIADDDRQRLDEIEQTLGTLEGVRSIEPGEDGRTLVVEHDEDVISPDEITSKVGSEGEAVTGRSSGPEEPEQADARAASGRSTTEPTGERAVARTTTTGDPARDYRSAGAGAEEDLDPAE